MEEKPQPGEPSASFFSVPESRWADVGPDSYRELSRLYLALGLALGELERELRERGETVETVGAPAEAGPAPANLSLQMHEAAGQLMAGVAADEQDLRQIISTLRTAFAVSWDLYSFRESEQVTVAEHMRNLRARIEDFERELLALRRAKQASHDSSSD